MSSVETNQLVYMYCIRCDAKVIIPRFVLATRTFEPRSGVLCRDCQLKIPAGHGYFDLAVE